MRLLKYIIIYSCLMTLLSACASGKKESVQTASPRAVTAADSTNLAAATEKEPINPVRDSLLALPVDLDIAHESFLRYLFLQHLNEGDLAIEFLRHALEANPANRYLSFTLAEELTERKQFDSAMVLAERAKNLPGDINASEAGLLATLYLRKGNTDSARVYYKKTIDENDEDYAKMYEYSLFLEWAEPVDEEELMRIYAILLPRLNYMKPMFSREMQLLLKNGRDTTLISLLDDAFNATHEIIFLMEKFSYFENKNQLDSTYSISEKMYQEFPQDSNAVKLYSAALITVGKPARASEVLRQFRALNDSNVLASVIFLQGLSLQAETKPDSAMPYYQLLLNDSAYGVRSHAALSDCYRMKQDTIRAVEYMEKANEVSGGLYFNNCLRLYMQYNLYDKIFSETERQIQKTETILEMLTLQKETDQDSVANSETNSKTNDLPELENVLSESDSLIALQNQYLFLLHLSAEYRNSYATKLFYAKPDSAKWHYQQALVQLNKFLEYQKTMPTGETAVDKKVLYSVSLPTIYFLRAAVLERLGNMDEAVQEFKKILKSDSKNHLALNYLGYMLIDKNRTSEELLEGIALVEAALALDSNNASYLDSKAWGFFMQKDYASAEKLLLEAAVAHSEILGDVAYWEHLGRILEAKGESEKAKECFRKIYELEPAHPYARQPKSEQQVNSEKVNQNANQNAEQSE